MLMTYLYEFLIRSADVVRMALFLQELLHPLLVFGLPSLGRLEFHMHCQVAIDDIEIRIARPHSHLLQEACLHLGSLSLVGTMEPEEVTVAVGEISYAADLQVFFLPLHRIMYALRVGSHIYSESDWTGLYFLQALS